MYSDTKMNSKSGPSSCKRRKLQKFAQKLCRCNHGVFASGRRVSSSALVHTKSYAAIHEALAVCILKRKYRIRLSSNISSGHRKCLCL
jgi:hypothetical protein